MDIQSAVFDHPEFSHEYVFAHKDPKTGILMFIAIHSNNYSRALGGCRMDLYQYATNPNYAALTDVLRLSRGMSYKSAISDIPLDGAKMVIVADPRNRTTDVLHAAGNFIDMLGGRYIGGEDMNVGLQDCRVIAERTKHIGGTVRDVSPFTAVGVFHSIKAAVKFKLGRDDIEGLSFAVQGIGAVGFPLCAMIHKEGGKLFIADLPGRQLKLIEAALEFNAVRIPTSPDGQSDIHKIPVDVFVPCAGGGIVNSRTVHQINARIIAGSANNVLENKKTGNDLQHYDILYAVDYCANAGGLIAIYNELEGHDDATIEAHIKRVTYDRMLEIFERSKVENKPTNVVADEMVESKYKFMQPKI